MIQRAVPQGLTAVITTFNSSRSIEKALLSIEAQIVPPDSLLVVDDGSTDSTVAIAQRFSPASVVALPHSGRVACSRNAAMRLATTAWVAFLDGDDEWLPQHVERFHNAQHAFPDMVVFCGNALRTTPAGPTEEHVVPVSGQTAAAISFLTLVTSRPVVASTAVVDRRVALSAGGFDESVRAASAEDFALWLEISKRGDVVFDPVDHARYAILPASLTRAYGGRRSRRASLWVLRRARQRESASTGRGLLLASEVAHDALRIALGHAQSQEVRATLAYARLAFGTGPRPLLTALLRSARRLHAVGGERHVVWSVFGSIVPTVASVFRQKITAMALGNQGLADLSVLASWTTPLATMASVLLAGFNREAASHGMSAPLVRGAAVVSGAILLLGSAAVAVVATKGSDLPTLLIVAFAAGVTVTTTIAGLAVSAGRLVPWMLAVSTLAIAQLLGAVVGIATGGRAGAVIGISLGSAIAGVVLLTFYIRNSPGSAKTFEFPRGWRAIGAANGVVALSLAFADSFTRQQTLTLSPSAGAKYHACLAITSVAYGALLPFIQARVMPAAVRKSGEPLDREVARVVRVVFGVVLVATAVAAIAGGRVLDALFARGVADAGSLLVMMTLGEGMVTLSVPFSTVLFVQRHNLRWVTSGLAPAASRAAAILLLLPVAGELASGVASIAAGTVALTVGVILTRQHGGE